MKIRPVRDTYGLFNMAIKDEKEFVLSRDNHNTEHLNLRTRICLFGKKFNMKFKSRSFMRRGRKIVIVYRVE